MIPERSSRAFVVGVGMTKFVKPGSRSDDYPEMVAEAVVKALQDAELRYEDIEQACVGYIYGENCSGQRALYSVGMTGIPIYNVNNACASGSTALVMARQFIEGGQSDCVLAVGFEKMQRGSLDGMAKYTDRAMPVERHVNVIAETHGLEASPLMAQFFGNAGREHMERYGTKPEHFAKIAQKNHKHSVYNANAQFEKEYSLDEILSSTMIHSPLTKLQCSPTSDGAAAVIVCSEAFLRRHPKLRGQAVTIIGQVMVTDLPSTFGGKSAMQMIGSDITLVASERLYRQTGKRPSDIDVIELHDCFSTNELIAYEGLQLCPIGKGGQLVDRGDNTYGGKWVINPSGGLISKGHPIGATGIAQCCELCWQLRNKAGKRQVPNAKTGLQHNIGIGGAVVLTMYQLASFSEISDQQTQSQPATTRKSQSNFVAPHAQSKL